MRLSRIFLSLVITASAAFAQTQQNWFPPVLENLSIGASSKTEFSLDHSMLVLASKADQDDDSLRRIIAGVDGISIHRFRFPADGMYDPRILNAVRQDYHRAGWQRIAGGHDRDGRPGSTELWLHLQNNAIRNIDVLFVGRNQVNFVAVSGSISPIDLMHLGGHFGIPPIQGGVVIPGQGASAPPPPYDRSTPPDYGAQAPRGSARPDNRPTPNASQPPYADDNQSPTSDGRSDDAAPPEPQPSDNSVQPENSAQPDNAAPNNPPNAPQSDDDDYRHPRSAPNANSQNPQN